MTTRLNAGIQTDIQRLAMADLELDLSFKAPEGTLPMLLTVDQSTKALLNCCDSWHGELKSWIKAIRADLHQPCPDVVRQTQAASVGLQFTDDEHIAKLNDQWRHRPGATDVLSFAALDGSIALPGSASVELGDIIISVETAARQAQQHQHTLQEELRWLVSHGLLHLLGWDHPDQQSLDKMLSYQEQLLGINGKVQDSGHGGGDATNTTKDVH